ATEDHAVHRLQTRGRAGERVFVAAHEQPERARLRIDRVVHVVRMAGARRRWCPDHHASRQHGPRRAMVSKGQDALFVGASLELPGGEASDVDGELVQAGIVTIAGELNLDSIWSRSTDTPHTAHGAPTPGPPHVRSGRRLGSLPSRMTLRAIRRRIFSSIWLTPAHRKMQCAQRGRYVLMFVNIMTYFEGRFLLSLAHCPAGSA